MILLHHKNAPQAVAENTTPRRFTFARKKTEPHPPTKGKKRRLIVLIVIIAVCAVGTFLFLKHKNAASVTSTGNYVTAQVTRQNVAQTLTGTGTLEAANSYSVTSLLEGKVISANFEEGDVVEKDSILYELDSSDAQSNLEKSELSLSQSERNYNTAVKSEEDLTVTATESGTVTDLKVKVGDDVKAGDTVATIQDSSVMTLKVAFPSDDADSFYVGESGTVTMDSSFETLSATISEISGATSVLTGNRIVREVTLKVTNPGGITTTQNATATINGVGSSNSGTFTYRAESTVTSKATGTVASLPVKEGDRVSKGRTLATLSSDTVGDKIADASDSVRSAQIALDSQDQKLDDYIIRSPISGTIIDKNYEVGETTESSKVLCTIYDLTYLTMTLNVDELDISNVSVGQAVTITADAAEGKTYQGVVTKVSVAGTTEDSVTSYPVTIQIDQGDGLLPGMNVDAAIQVSQASDALAIPVSALERGNKVLVTKDSPSAANALSDPAPEGYAYVSVTTGISGDTMVEITAGLTEGDTVAYQEKTASSDTQTPQMGMGMGMGMGGGGMPSGGGGMPSGGGGMPSGGGSSSSSGPSSGGSTSSRGGGS